MDFIDQIKQFSKRVDALKSTIQTEEATKTSIIMPFFSMLGYDVFDPLEFSPEYTADVGIKKGEKVDYAIMADGQPTILIEAKWIGEALDKHDSQLFRYFGTTTAKFGILTNGIIYKFYTDLEAPNKMDETPFLEVNILDLREAQIAELKKFHKTSFSVDEIINVASELKYTSEFKRFFSDELQNPDDDMVKLFVSNVYHGVKTQAIIEKFRPIVKKAINQFISESMSDKIKIALNPTPVPDAPLPEAVEALEAAPERKIETTQDELEAFFYIRTLLKDTVPFADITYKDTESYFGVLYKQNTRKWICRLVLTSSQKTLILPDENKDSVRYALESVYDIETYKDKLVEVVQRYM